MVARRPVHAGDQRRLATHRASGTGRLDIPDLDLLHDMAREVLGRPTCCRISTRSDGVEDSAATTVSASMA
jgi:hypothetical protein